MSAPQWLADFQAQFGTVLREPLDRSTGTLRAARGRYDPRLCQIAERERLAVYNRQYWFRLFGLMASAFPLSARLLGHWAFNDLVTRYLLRHPPTGWDIERVPDSFTAYLEETRDLGAAQTLERTALLQGATIDAAWRRVFLAPTDPVYRPSAADAQLLPLRRLRRSERVAFVAEDWPLLELRRSVVGDPAESAVALPARLPERRFWALVSTPKGVGELALDPLEARLLELLADHSLVDALARLESAVPEDSRPALPVRTRDWLARSVRLGFWSGFVEP